MGGTSLGLREGGAEGHLARSANFLGTQGSPAGSAESPEWLQFGREPLLLTLNQPPVAPNRIEYPTLIGNRFLGPPGLSNTATILIMV